MYRKGVRKRDRRGRLKRAREEVLGGGGGGALQRKEVRKNKRKGTWR